MAPVFRVIDTGVRDGRKQIAFDQALIDLHRAGKSPDTVRFLRFESSALVGRHQAIAHELKLQHCRANGIGLVRRITGGGAIYLDPDQVGWELVLSRARLPMPALSDYTRSICEAVAYGLSKTFDIDARFRPRNDIEVNGRKLCGTGGFFDGDTLFYQGTVLVDADPARIMACLNVPEAKVKKHVLDKPESRIVTLKSLLGNTAPAIAAVHQAVLDGLVAKLGISLQDGTPTAEEEALSAQLHTDEYGTDEFVFSIDDPRRGSGDVFESTRTGPGGTISAYVRVEGPSASRRIRELLITGDFFVTPPRMIFDLESRLRGIALGDAGRAVDSFFDTAKPDLLSIAPADFRAVIEAALLPSETP